MPPQGAPAQPKPGPITKAAWPSSSYAFWIKDHRNALPLEGGAELRKDGCNQSDLNQIRLVCPCLDDSTIMGSSMIGHFTTSSHVEYIDKYKNRLDQPGIAEKMKVCLTVAPNQDGWRASLVEKKTRRIGARKRGAGALEPTARPAPPQPQEKDKAPHRLRDATTHKKQKDGRLPKKNEPKPKSPPHGPSREDIDEDESSSYSSGEERYRRALQARIESDWAPYGPESESEESDDPYAFSSYCS